MLGVLPLLVPLLLGLVVVLDPELVLLDAGLLVEVLGVVVVVVPVPVSLVMPSAVVTVPLEGEVPVRLPEEEVGPPTLPELNESVPCMPPVLPVPASFNRSDAASLLFLLITPFQVFR